MANKIQIRRGIKAALPSLDEGEFGLAIDTDEIYLGNPSGAGNLLVNQAISGVTTTVAGTDNYLAVFSGTNTIDSSQFLIFDDTEKYLRLAQGNLLIGNTGRLSWSSDNTATVAQLDTAIDRATAQRIRITGVLGTEEGEIQFGDQTIIKSEVDGAITVNTSADLTTGVGLLFGGNTATDVSLRRATVGNTQFITVQRGDSSVVTDTGIAATTFGLINVAQQTNNRPIWDFNAGFILNPSDTIKWGQLNDLITNNDLGIKRISSGILGITDGSTGYGQLRSSNFSIGTAPDSARLIKVSSAIDSLNEIITSSSSNLAGIDLTNSSIPRSWRIYNEGTTGSFIIRDITGANNRIEIDTAGNITLNGTLAFDAGISMGDDANLNFGDGSNYWFVYNSVGTQFDFRSTNVDGAGGDGVVWSVEDGTDDVAFTGDISLNIGSKMIFDADGPVMITSII